MSQKSIFLVGFVVVVGLAIPLVLTHFTGSAPQESIQPLPNEVLPSAEPLSQKKSAAPSRAKPADNPAQSLVDHQAEVAIVTGDVKILHKGQAEWASLKEGHVVQSGDQIKTGPGSSSVIFYDKYYLNMAQINENSMAEFLSIEPTKIFISSGELFNDLEGLPDGTPYDIVTPTSVAGIRGTAFVRSYDAALGIDTTTVLRGKVHVNLRTEKVGISGRSFEVGERSELNFSRDQLESGNIAGLDVKSASPVMLEAYRVLFGQMHERLAEYAGGEEELSNAMRHWEALKENPEAMENVKKEIQVMAFYVGSPGSEPSEKKEDVLKAVSEKTEMPQVKAPEKPEAPKMVTLEKPKKVTGNGKDETMVVAIDVCKTSPDACEH